MTADDLSIRPLRADARENRERLLRAAGRQFAACGPDVALETVARASGVGIGTLYRHFPTREALIEAVYHDELGQLCASAGKLLAQRSPDVALEEWMERFVAAAATKPGLAGALKAVAESPSDRFPTTRERLLAAVGALLGAGIATGRIRADVAAEDVLGAMNALWSIPAEGEQWATQARRVLRLLMDGLRFAA